MRKMGILPGLVGLLICASPSAAQEVYRSVAPEKLEAIFKEMNINARKVPSKDDGVIYYHFKHEGYEVRLHNYNGKDLWLDSVFTDKMTPEMVNRWNLRAKMSRAVLIKDKEAKQDTVSFESQIDCVGGVTDAIVKRFIGRFHEELMDFGKFVTK